MTSVKRLLSTLYMNTKKLYVSSLKIVISILVCQFSHNTTLTFEMLPEHIESATNPPSQNDSYVHFCTVSIQEIIKYRDFPPPPPHPPIKIILEIYLPVWHNTSIAFAY